MANREQEKEAKGVDSVTDYIEEKEENVDMSKATAGLSSLVSTNNADSGYPLKKNKKFTIFFNYCFV